MCFMTVVCGVSAPFRNTTLRQAGHKITVKASVFIAHKTLQKLFFNSVSENLHTFLALPKLL